MSTSSKCNGCGTLFDKTDEKSYILGRNKWYGKVGPLNNTKWAKGTPTTGPERDAYLIVDHI